MASGKKIYDFSFHPDAGEASINFFCFCLAYKCLDGQVPGWVQARSRLASPTKSEIANIEHRPQLVFRAT